jgi:hypothetical protein
MPLVCTRTRTSGWRELTLLAALYGGYCITRSLADDSFPRAADAARTLRALEGTVGLDVEAAVSSAVAAAPWLAVAMSYWYASLHFVVTGAVLLWAYRRRRPQYPQVRNGLLLATTAALLLYLVLPTAPPRLLGAPFHDVLAETAAWGWWSAGAGHDAAGGITNELAAFPSMHAGWALWVALVLWRFATRFVGWLGVAYACGTAAVVVGTGNHWILDVLAGWGVVVVSCSLTSAHFGSARAARNGGLQPAGSRIVAACRGVLEAWRFSLGRPLARLRAGRIRMGHADGLAVVRLTGRLDGRSAPQAALIASQLPGLADPVVIDATGLLELDDNTAATLVSLVTTCADAGLPVTMWFPGAPKRPGRDQPLLGVRR